MIGQFRKYLLVLVTGLVIGLFLYKFRNSFGLSEFHWANVRESIRHTRLSLLLLSAVANLACYALRSLRWMRFSRTVGQTHFGNVFSATLMGFTATFILGSAGEPVRPVLIGKRDSISIPAMFGVYVLERVFDLAATIAIASYSLLSFARRGLISRKASTAIKMASSSGALLLVSVLAMITFLIYFRYYGGEWLRRKLQREKWRTGWRKKIAVVFEGFSNGLQGIRTVTDLTVLLAYTAAHWILLALIYMWIAHALDGPLASISLTGAMLLLSFAALGSIVQLPAVGGGPQAGMFLVLILVFGVSKELALTVAILIWLTVFGSCCAIGLPLLFREGWSMGELRRMATVEERAGEAALLDEAERAVDSMPKGTLR